MGDRLGAAGLAGCALILACVLLVQLQPLVWRWFAGTSPATHEHPRHRDLLRHAAARPIRTRPPSCTTPACSSCWSRCCCRRRPPTSASTRPRARCSSPRRRPQRMLALGTEGVEALRAHDRPVPHEDQAPARDLPHPDRAARRRGAARPRGAGGAARRGPQDGQRRPQRGVRRADAGGRHARVPRLQPHRPGARQDAARRRAEAARTRAGEVPGRRAPLADPARPLRVPGAHAAVRPLRRRAAPATSSGACPTPRCPKPGEAAPNARALREAGITP